jgi:4-amino-4-deoxy-L-arabinose transferase-like glycosyltransferase
MRRPLGQLAASAARAIGGTRARAATFVALVTAVLVLPPLGQRLVVTTDEARFVLYAREVLTHRALFDVRLRGKLFREKPPLYAWAIAALSLPAGKVTEASAQAPVALAAILAAVFTCLLGDRLFNRRVGLGAGLILATTAGFFRHSQILLPDMLVLGFATAATYWLWRAAEFAPPRGARVLFYLALALAVYAKGPLGLLPLLVGAIWLATQGGLRAVARLWSPAGLLLFLAVTFTWVGPFLALGTGSYAHTVIWQDWLAAYAGGGPGRALTRGASDALGFFAPWILLVPLALGRAVAQRRAPAVAFALLTFAVPLVAVVMSAHYRTRYLLASTPGFALLVAWWVDAHVPARSAAARALAWVVLAGAAGASALGVLPRLAGLRGAFGALPGLRGALGIPELSAALIPVALAGWVLALSLWEGLRRGRPTLLVGGVAATTAALILYGTWVHLPRFNTMGEIPHLASRLEAHARGGEAGVLYETGWLEVDYYLGRSLHEIWKPHDLEQYVEGGSPVLASEATWTMLEPKISERVRVLERVRARGKNFVILGRAQAS